MSLCRFAGGCTEAGEAIAKLTEERDAALARVAALETLLRLAVQASDNEGGSASDAVQDMLDLIEEHYPGAFE